VSLVFSNQGGSILRIGVDNVAPVIDVVDASSFPDLSGEQTFYLVLENTLRTEFEVCLATSIDKGLNQITVTRGVGGTSAIPFSAGAFAENRLTKTTLESLVQSLPESGVGDDVNNLIKLTQSEYDGITPNATSLYMIPGSSGGGLSAVQVYTSNDTWTKPAGLTRALVWCQGGGGAGGGTFGAVGSQNAGTAGGGGGGAFVAILIEAASLGATETVTVASTTAGTSGGNGSTGGTTSFGAHATALGGVGGLGVFPGTGLGPTVVNGGLGGSPSSSGDIEIDGSPGGHGSSFGSVVVAGAVLALGGYGGDSHLGTGARGGVLSGAGTAAGVDGIASGGGGSGGMTTGSQSGNNTAGGAGAAGVCVVWEFS
jgi:hypothetical protein